MNTPPKRRFPRYACQLPIELRRRGVFYPLRSATSVLSVGGSYVPLTSVLAPGIVADVVLWAGDTKLKFGATVRNADRTGSGIEFTGIRTEQRDCLQLYLERANAPTLR